MIRSIAAIAVTLSLAACSDDGVVSRATETLSTQSGDSRIAKVLFGAVEWASSQRAEAVGFYSRGCQAGAVQLPETGPTWQAMRLNRNRNWGQPELVDYIQDLSQFAATLPGWEGIYVGDMSQPRGGPMLTGHASHQVGLDVDIWMLPPDRLDLSRSERESLSSISMRRQSGAFTNNSWTVQHMELMRAAASDPRVERIFVFPGAKVAMCNWATGDRSWLAHIRPWYGHHYHFHVRLNCPAGDRSCENQAPVPAGDGCADAQQWVDNILNPPPPDPDAPPPTPRAEITMARLPAQCTEVLESD